MTAANRVVPQWWIDSDLAPVVSVVVPAYGRHDIAPDALASVASQSWHDWEAIVVDDGSEPPIGLGEFSGDPRFRILRHDRNRGPAAARNTGVGASTGKWIAFLDSDDRWEATKLARQLHFAHSSEAAGAGAYATGWRYVSNGKAGPAYLPRGGESLRRFAGGCWFCPGSTLLVRRDVVDRIGRQQEDLPRLEDYEWFLRFGLHGLRLRVLSEPLALVGRGNVPSPERVRRATDLIRRRYLQAGEESFLADRVARARARAYLALNEAGSMMRSGRTMPGLAALARSIFWRPRLHLQVERYWEIAE